MNGAEVINESVSLDEIQPGDLLIWMVYDTPKVLEVEQVFRHGGGDPTIRFANGEMADNIWERSYFQRVKFVLRLG